jgi:hypothetical protein
MNNLVTLAGLPAAFLALVAQLPSPSGAEAQGWFIIVACAVVLTLGGAVVTIQKVIINARVLRREDVPQQVRVENETQRRDTRIVTDPRTVNECDKIHATLDQNRRDFRAQHETTHKQIDECDREQWRHINKHADELAQLRTLIGDIPAKTVEMIEKARQL